MFLALKIVMLNVFLTVIIYRVLKTITPLALFTSEQPKKNKMAFVGILSPIKLHFGPLVSQLVWYILTQLFTSVSVKVVDIYLAAKYPPLFTSTSVNN